MKLLLLVCVSLAAGAPVLEERSQPTSVYDYYDFVEIPRNQPLASSRSDSLMARSSGPLPRRIALPLPPRRPPSPIKQRNPFPGPRPQKLRPFREPDYQLTETDALPPLFRERPKYQKPKPQPLYQPRPQRPQVRKPRPPFFEYDEISPAYEDEPFYPENESAFAEQSPFPKESPVYQNQRPVTRDHEYPIYEDDAQPQYQDHTRPGYQEERRPQYSEERLPQYQEPKRPAYQEERRPQFQEERRPQYEEERNPQYQEERLPQYEEERGPLYQEERQPQYQDEILPEYHEERQPVYQETLPQYQEERPPYYQEEPLPPFEEPSKRDRQRQPLNDFPTTKEKTSDPVKEKRDAIHGGDGHLDANGVQFAADAAAVENAKGAGRLAFQIHGQQGPHSYRFGYDTGKGYNRQFRYEERDGDGLVHGRYGFYDKDGKLQVVNYSAHPEHGYSADVPH